MNHAVRLPNPLRGNDKSDRVTRVKVLHLINGEHFSGAERVQDLLALSMESLGYHIGFACLKSGRFPAERQSQNHELVELNMRSRIDFRAVRRLKKVIETGDYQIIHAHTPRTLLVASLVARSLGRPLVYHVHSPVGRDSTRSLVNRMNQWVESWSARQVDHFICVSESLAHYMEGLGHHPEKISTVPNGVATVVDVPNRSAPTGPWTLGTVALFRPRKGTEVLLEALAALRQRGHDVRLLAVGPFETGSYRQSIQRKVSDLGLESAVEWTGFTSDVAAQFRRMDLFVLPSLFGEGLPMVVLESMAVGLPVVAANVEGIPQAIRDGRDGLIFEAGDPSHLERRINEWIEGQHDWSALRDSALHRQRSFFSDQSMAAGVAQVYHRLLAKRTKRTKRAKRDGTIHSAE